MSTIVPQSLTFRKMHGAGNDFVILDSRGQTARGLGARTTPELARALGDRHRGVGFDQLAEMRDDAADDDADAADLALDFWNADGSMAGACGNATRCVAWLVMRETGRDRLTIRTERGLLTAVRQDGRVWVNMGAPLLDWQAIPLAGPGDSQHLPLPGDPVAVGMGNPHCVFIVADAEAVALDTLGPRYEHDPLFPQRTNVEFVSLTGQDRLRMRVWERGAGVTLACGSGACAVAVATAQRGLTGRRVVMDLDGGTLEADWRDDGVWLTGPVAEVFTGTLSAEALATP
ncbi:MAG: diaminopimelate epimerase [Rhodobacter sp.]|uniref:diaminopimelate epimerase n=1 Tax=Pararhodobacter sp. TaxID=2127056 RepID=UPI001D3FB216|nr:diaminopimelate epimerase [Pararhodobacter sp.]MCB1344013.1 diaminopimelate epimerase [Paracoccaceae bacterium]MCC0074889.1 diaminopimelate epimerase [Rhodobacter sp.]HPD90889.1 diaminopimelate epimerase [Pararhodobacter sp.]